MTFTLDPQVAAVLATAGDLPPVLAGVAVLASDRGGLAVTRSCATH